jgi:hypothetical protein
MAQLLQGFGQEASPATLDSLTSARTLARRFVAWLAERRVRAATMRELSLLGPRDLQDLSITPTDFPAIANGTWKR